MKHYDNPFLQRNSLKYFSEDIISSSLVSKRIKQKFPFVPIFCGAFVFIIVCVFSFIYYTYINEVSNKEDYIKLIDFVTLAIYIVFSIFCVSSKNWNNKNLNIDVIEIINFKYVKITNDKDPLYIPFELIKKLEEKGEHALKIHLKDGRLVEASNIDSSKKAKETINLLINQK